MTDLTRSHLLAAALGVLLGVVLSLFVVADAASRGVPNVTKAEGRALGPGSTSALRGAPQPDGPGFVPPAGRGARRGISGDPQPTATVLVTPAPSANRLLTAPKLGVASWYDGGPGIYAAAGPGLRRGDWRGTEVIVTADGFSVRVQLIDHCYCRVGGATRLIDLSPAAFMAPCGSLGRGLCKVEVFR